MANSIDTKNELLSRLTSNFGSIGGWAINEKDEDNNTTYKLTTTDHTTPVDKPWHVTHHSGSVSWPTIVPGAWEKYYTPSVGPAWEQWLGADKAKHEMLKNEFSIAYENFITTVMRVMFNEELSEPEKFYIIQQGLAQLINAMYEIDAEYAETELAEIIEE